MPGKKILISANWEGVAYNIQTKALANELSKDHEVLYISQGNIGEKKVNINKNLSIIQWPTRRAVTWRDAFFFLKQLLYFKPDILIVHYDSTVLCMIFSWLARVKYRIGWIHTSSTMYTLDVNNKKKVEGVFKRRKIVYGFATHAIVMTEFSKKDIMLNYKIPEKKIVKIPNGIYGAEFSNNENKILMRYVGRLDFSKGVDILIKAFKKIAGKNHSLTLEIVGRGDDMENLKRLVEKENLSDNVLFHGYWRDYEKVRKFIGEAYCILLPTRADNFPTIILEAFSSGVPVIASEIGGISEMYTNGKEGFLIEGEDENAFAFAMQQLIDDAGLRTKMGMAAKRKFEENFTMEKHILCVTDFLNTLL